MLSGPALDVICENISDGMEECKKRLFFTTGSMDIAYLKTWSVNGIMESVGLLSAWTRILEAVTTGPHSNDNVLKCPRLVSFSITSYEDEGISLLTGT